MLLFSYGLREVPVDTHVSRVGMRLHLLRPGISLDPTAIETNIVFLDLTGSIGAPAAVELLLSRGIRVGAMGQRTIRAVTHLDVSTEGIDRALEGATEVFT